MSATSTHILGFAPVDEDHKELLRLARQLGDLLESTSERKAIAEAYGALVAYTEEHFRREEEFMRDSNFADLEAHAHEHAEILKWLTYRDRHTPEHSETLSSEGVLDVLSAWIVDHLRAYDEPMCRWLLSSQVVKPSTGAADAHIGPNDSL